MSLQQIDAGAIDVPDCTTFEPIDTQTGGLTKTQTGSLTETQQQIQTGTLR